MSTLLLAALTQLKCVSWETITTNCSTYNLTVFSLLNFSLYVYCSLTNTHTGERASAASAALLGTLYLKLVFCFFSRVGSVSIFAIAIFLLLPFQTYSTRRHSCRCVLIKHVCYFATICLPFICTVFYLFDFLYRRAFISTSFVWGWGEQSTEIFHWTN